MGIGKVVLENLITYFPDLLTYSFKPLEGHRASTTVLHLGRSLAAVFASAHVSWQAFSTDSMVRLHVVVGLPLHLLPCGFQSNAFLVMLLFWRLRIWPILFHLRFLMVSVRYFQYVAFVPV